MPNPVRRADIHRKIDSANHSISESYGRAPDNALVEVTRALAQAMIANASATMYLAERVEGIESTLDRELPAMRAEMVGRQ